MSYFDDIARSIKRYEPSDRAALREFQRAHFGAASRQCDDSFFEWLFERNPHRDDEGASLWLCKRDGIVVGQQASIPVLLKVGDQEYRAAWFIDWMVHPDWRLKGVAPALFAASMANTEVMLGLGVEDLASRTVRRAGWKGIGSLSLFVRPLDPYAYAKGRKSLQLLSMLVPRALVRGSAHVIGRIAASAARVSIDPIAIFDERVNDVWSAARREYPILVKRDLANLRWRFDEGPFRALYKRYYFSRRGEVIGYAVLRFEKRHGHVIGRVVDHLAQRQWLAPLLALIIDELNARGAIAVFFEQWLEGSEWILRSLGCLRTPSSHQVMFKVRDRATPLAGVLAQAHNWFITPGDSDFDHILIDTDSNG